MMIKYYIKYLLKHLNNSRLFSVTKYEHSWFIFCLAQVPTYLPMYLQKIICLNKGSIIYLHGGP